MSGYHYQDKHGSWKNVTVRTLPALKGVPNKCTICNKTKNLTIDHKLPRSTNPKAKGMLANYQLLCQQCNERKDSEKPFLYNFKTKHKKPL